MLLISLLIIKIYTGAPNSTNDNLYSTLLQKPMKKKSLFIDSKISSISMDNNYLFVCLFTVN